MGQTCLVTQISKILFKYIVTDDRDSVQVFGRVFMFPCVTLHEYFSVYNVILFATPEGLDSARAAGTF